jgi:hypothetical protein
MKVGPRSRPEREGQEFIGTGKGKSSVTDQVMNGGFQLLEYCA